MTRPLRVVVSVLMGVLLITALSACASNAAPPLELTSGDNDSRQALGVGQRLKITLDSNPSTGFVWAVDGVVPAQLEQLGEPRYSTQSSLAGAGGAEVWTFAGTSVGRGTLKLKYWRSFEPTVAPADTFEVTVDVR